MKTRSRFAVLFSALLALAGTIAGPTHATVSLVVDAQGTLTGANNVVVNGAAYNVSFVDGSCVSLFGNCTTFTMSTYDTPGMPSGVAAASALRDQVFVPNSSFDQTPGLTRGCGTSINGCWIITPTNNTRYNGSVTSTTLLYNYDTRAAAFQNTNGAGSSMIEMRIGPPGSSAFLNVLSTTDPIGGMPVDLVWAVWTGPVPAVPEPSQFMLMAAGGLTLSLFIRRRRICS